MKSTSKRPIQAGPTIRRAALAAGILLVVLLPSAAAAHAPDVALRGFGTATIDGVIAAGEWDGAGRIDFAAPAARRWIVDLTPPETTIANGPSSPSRERSATILFAGVDETTGPPLTFECTLDSQPPFVCASPHALERLGDGRHTFQVRAIDLAGNADLTPARHDWTVDGTPPTRPTVRGLRRTASRRPVYRFSARDALTASAELRFRCSVDSPRLHACSRVLRPRMQPGKHVLRVAALDKAGNMGTTARVVLRVVKR